MEEKYVLSGKKDESNYSILLCKGTIPKVSTVYIPVSKRTIGDFSLVILNAYACRIYSDCESFKYDVLGSN